MITLLTYPAGFGKFSYSPFCVKAGLFLNASGQDWIREDLDDPRKMPMQKLPCIRIGEKVIADSQNIRLHLEGQGATFDAGLTDADVAHSHALIRMAEEHMYFFIVADCWGNDANWAVIRETYFGMIPKVLRGIITYGIRRESLRGLHAQGIGRMDEQARFDRVQHDLDALRTQLGAKPFLFGDTPTAADYSVGPMIEGMMAIPVPTKLSSYVNADQKLTAYANRVSALLT